MVKVSIGDTFGHLKVLERVENYISPKGNAKSRWKCLCDCGNITNVVGGDLTAGKVISCGCVNKKNRSRLRNDLTGRTFYMLYVISVCEREPYKKTKYFCQCECGNYTIVSGSHLISGRTKSCGCLHKKQLGESRRENISGNRYGYLKAIKPAGRDAYKNVLWECVCDCGNVTYVSVHSLKSGNTKSCGCKKSKLEVQTEKLLCSLGIKHKWHYSPPDLRTSNGGLCEFDFLIPYDLNSIAYIECQGIQHYRNTGEFGKLQREETDELKRVYCKHKNIQLFEIRYDEDVEVKLREIIDTLHVNPVPDAAQSAA